MKLILDLCGGTGAWSKPYREAGYDVEIVDLPMDIRLIECTHEYTVHGILAAPPCTDLAVSGARWWSSKGKEALLDALSIVDACLRMVVLHKPKWWCLENPVGRLSNFLGKPVMNFDPYEFGDPYRKRTCLWGEFNIPEKNPVEPTEGSRMNKMHPHKYRSRDRSITPQGFAKAFYKANP